MIKKLIKRLILRENSSSNEKIKYLRKIGISIGNGTTIFDPKNTFIDETRPWLIKIGDNVQITKGVTILSHGFDWAVLKGKYGDVIGSSGPVHIGNNVFIGMNSTILKGVSIGNNCIIGANSLVNKSIPNDVVVAGNPAKVICSLDEYYVKRIDSYESEAIILVKEFRKKYGRNPGEKELHEYFWLFSDSRDKLPILWKQVNELVNPELTEVKFKNNIKKYDSFESLLNSIK